MDYPRLAFGLLVSAAASAAHAQVTPDAMLKGSQPRTFEASARLEVQHETNVARASNAAAQAQGIEQEDTYAEPALNVNLVQPIGQQAVFLSGGASYVIHDKNEILDSARFNVTGGVGGSVGPCATVIAGTYVQGRTREEDTALSISIRNIQKVTSGNVSLTCARPSGLGLIAQGGVDSTRNSQTGLANGNSETTRGSVGLRYGRPAFGSISLTANYSDTEYQDQPPTALGPGGFLTRGLGVQFERRLGGRIQANIGVAYTESEAQDVPPLPPGIPATNGALNDFSGITYNGDITYRASSRLDARLGFERGVRPTQVPGGSHEIATSFDAALNYRLGSRIVVTLTGEQRKASQVGDIPANALAVESARTRVGGVSLRYRLGQRITFALTGQHQRHDTDNPLFNYRNNMIGLSTELRY